MQFALLRSAVDGMDANAPDALLTEISTAAGAVADAKRGRVAKLTAVQRARDVLARWQLWRRGSSTHRIIDDD